MRSLLKLIVLSVVSAIALAELYHPLRALFPETWMAPALVHTALAAVVLFLAHRRGTLRTMFELKPWIAYLPAAVVLGGVALLVFVSRLTGNAPTGDAALPWAWILWIPVVEELVFRAGIGGAFRKVSGSALWGAWFSAVTFALVHADPTLSRVAHLELGLPLGPFLLGLLCEGIYVKSGRILPVILLHAVCNATPVLFAHGDARWLTWLGFLYS